MKSRFKIGRRNVLQGMAAGMVTGMGLSSTSGPALAAGIGALNSELRLRLAGQELPFTPILPPTGAETLQILVSLKHQQMLVYAGEMEIGRSEISTGKPGKETPHGIFSVISKHEFRWSNLYEREPMPFMQRLTWSGIAMHAGELPGYPASHGCVRMPGEFARQLYDLETADRHVVISQDPASPLMVANSALPKLASGSSD